jgi:hypothetical protein
MAAYSINLPFTGILRMTLHGRKQTVRFRPKEDIESFSPTAVIDLPVIGQALCQSGLDVLAQLIQRAAHVGIVRGDRRVNHRLFDILVAQRRLNGANVGARRQQMTGKTVPEGRRADVLVDLRLSRGSPERPPKRAGGRVPARHLVGIAPRANKRRREYKLPGEGLRR